MPLSTLTYKMTVCHLAITSSIRIACWGPALLAWMNLCVESILEGTFNTPADSSILTKDLLVGWGWVLSTIYDKTQRLRVFS